MTEDDDMADDDSAARSEIASGDRLTGRESEFAFQFLRNNGDASRAYRSAYSADSMSDTTVRREAHDVRHRPRVAARIAELQDAARRLSEESLVDYLLELQSLKIQCLAAGSYGAAVKATELKGKVQGRFIDHLKIEGGEEPAELLQALRGMLSEHRYQILCEMLGVETVSPAADAKPPLAN